MSNPQQLALPFAEAREYSAADFLDAPANAEARAWLSRSADWPGRRLLLWGEAGAGKSHLLHLWARRAGALVLTGPSLVLPIAPLMTPLALDDADQVAPEPNLLHLLNVAGESGFPLLMAARAPPARWPVRLADLASRLAAVAAVEVGVLDDGMLAQLFARVLSLRQLHLAPPLASFLLARLPRHPAALAEAAARLDRAGLATGRPLTRSLALTALSPLIGPGSEADFDHPGAHSSPAHPVL